MRKEVLYTYLGTNGTISSTVHLEDVYYIRNIRIWADEKKLLTKDGNKFYYRVTVPEEEAHEWYEVSELVKGQK